jgi:hypothetical protein
VKENIRISKHFLTLGYKYIGRGPSTGGGNESFKLGRGKTSSVPGAKR